MLTQTMLLASNMMATLVVITVVDVSGFGLAAAMDESEGVAHGGSVRLQCSHVEVKPAAGRLFHH